MALSVVVINAIGDALLEVLRTPYIKSGTDAPFAGEMTAVEFYETLIEPSITCLTIGMAIPIAGVI